MSAPACSTADPKARQLHVARCAVGVLTALLLTVVVGTYLTGHVNRRFADYTQVGLAARDLQLRSCRRLGVRAT